MFFMNNNSNTFTNNCSANQATATHSNYCVYTNKYEKQMCIYIFSLVNIIWYGASGYEGFHPEYALIIECFVFVPPNNSIPCCFTSWSWNRLQLFTCFADSALLFTWSFAFVPQWTKVQHLLFSSVWHLYYTTLNAPLTQSSTLPVCCLIWAENVCAAHLETALIRSEVRSKTVTKTVTF